MCDKDLSSIICKDLYNWKKEGKQVKIKQKLEQAFLCRRKAND